MRPNEEIFSVLLVEDNPEDLVLFKKSLEQDHRYPSHVDAARTIQEAFEMIKRNTYHVLLVESKLREEEGLRLLEEMNGANIFLPFILMTPIRDDLLVREAMRRGVAGLIIKNESQFQYLAEKLRESYKKFYEGNKTDKKDEPDGFIKQKPFSKEFDIDEQVFQKQKPEFAEPAIRDELTGVFNHGYIHERIVREFSRASRYSYPISCLMVDVDHFKSINEEKGYRVGDLLLKEFAQFLFDNCRLSDLIGRYGGTEFLILLPHVSYHGTQELAKRLRNMVTEHVFLQGTENIHITLSVGMSSFPEDFMNRRSDLIAYARRALLHAKAAGRNLLILYRDMDPVVETKMPKLEISEEKIAEFRRRISEVAENARRDCLKFSRDLISALESKDAFTAGHGTNCSKYARRIADAMGLSVQESEVVENAALLHDIGKICIPDVILLKTGKLTFNEYEIIKQHAYYGYKILNPIKFLHEEALLILHHHEWFNGEGYPCHLKGDEIPLGSRIIGVIDAYDTMRVSGGRYRKTVTVEQAVNELVNYAAVQFDPMVVKYFIEVLKHGKELSADTYNKEVLEQAIKTANRKKTSDEQTPH